MGLIVGLSGMDGSGKTTVAKLVVGRLQSQGLKVTYHHELDFLLLKPIFRLITKLVGSKRAENAKERSLRNMEQSKPLYAGIYYFLVWLDNLIYYLYFKLKRGIIVHDRWPYDIPAIFDYRHYKNRFIEKLLLGFPRPDTLILLTVPPEVALLRKRDDPSDWHQSIEFYRVLGPRMSEIARKLKYDAIIDSNRPIDEVVDDVLTVITNLKKARFSIVGQDKQSEIRFFDKLAEETRHPSKLTLDWTGKRLERLGLSQTRNQLILEVGSGTGTYGITLALKGNAVVGIDISSKATMVAKEWAREENVNFLPIVGDIEMLPFKSHCFDVCLSALTLHHFPALGPVVEEIARVLKSGARIALIEPNGSNPVRKVNAAIGRLVSNWLERIGGTTQNERAHNHKRYIKTLQKHGFTDITVASYYMGKPPWLKKEYLHHSERVFYFLFHLVNYARLLAISICAKTLPQPYCGQELLITARRGKRKASTS